MRRWLAVLGGLVLAAVAPVAAHSLLLESSPAAGATLTTAPARASLRFNNRIEKRLSRMRLLDRSGAARPLEVAVSEGEADRLIAAVPPLSPGNYRLEWQVLSTDGHLVTGSFTFRLAP
jgi:copper resistance protein C